MKLRPARTTDTFALVDILVARQRDSRFNGVVDVDQPYARKALAGAIQRHGGTNDGACFVMVAVDADDRPRAFVMGVLGRVYGIGEKLCASDQFLIGFKDCPARTLERLFDAYVEWASSCPKVVEIGASWNDAVPGSEAFDAAYRRRGFMPCATIYRRDAIVGNEREAA